MTLTHGQIDARQQIERVIGLGQVAIDSKRLQHVDIGIKNGRAADQYLLARIIDLDLPANVDAARIGKLRSRRTTSNGR